MNTLEAVESPAQAIRRGPSRGATERRGFLAALQRGDRRAAEELVERTYEQVFASLLRMSGDADLSADLTQETYARAWRALDKFEGRCRVSTWIYRIAYTTFLNHIRRPQRLLPLDDRAATELESPRPLPSDDLLRRTDERRLRRAVVELPAELSFTVSARFWGELPVREIASLEGVSTVAIRKRLRRAMKLLRLALDEEGAS